MKILHITSVTNPSGNGVAVAVSNYFLYESKYADVALYNVEKDIISNSCSFNIKDYENISALPNGFNRPDLVVFNEIYKPIYLRLYKECIIKNIPYVIIPHGCLTKKSQRKKWLKKFLANNLLFKKFIFNSAAIQYLNELEKESSIIKEHKFIISGNGITISNEKAINYKNKNFVYIGRYDVKVKGLDLLIDTIVSHKEWFLENNVKINLYGRNSGTGYNTLVNMISKNTLSDILILNDAIYGKDKERVLLNSYAFIQVSRHEGQPMGIMEALSYGVPCIVTHGTSFGEYVNINECGIGINFNSQELFNAIKKIFSDEKLRNRFSLNSKIVDKNYDWMLVSKKCINTYKNLLL